VRVHLVLPLAGCIVCMPVSLPHKLAASRLCSLLEQRHPPTGGVCPAGATRSDLDPTRAGTEVVKVRDRQRLEIEEEGGRLVAMTMVSRPQLLMPTGGYMPMGDVRFRVAAADYGGVPGCKVPQAL